MLIWSDVPGWFSFLSAYDAAIERAVDGATFVELGTFCGRSACYMAQQIKASGKQIRFDTVDNFTRSFGLTSAATLQFIAQCGFSDLISLREMHQLEAVGLYADHSLDFVFFDSDHSYDGTKAALLAYLPKMKSGGVIAGDDYSKRFPGVIQAVDEVIPGRTVDGAVFSYSAP